MGVKHRKKSKEVEGVGGWTPLFFFLLGLGGCSGKPRLDRSVDLPADARASLVDRHNELRRWVAQGKIPGQPPAANMSRLQWDEKLATLAKDWAEFCVLDHRIHAGALPAWAEGTGENLFAMGAAELPSDLKSVVEKAMDAWFEEHRHFAYPKECSRVCGHYTQMVWAETDRIGCGVASCKSINQKDGRVWSKQGYVLVCNYKPAGNIVGQPPYEMGPAGSRCPPAHPSKEEGLCR